MTWLREAAEAPNRRISSSRVTALVAVFTLSFCAIVMTLGMFWEKEFVMPLTTALGLLGAMGGANYVANRITTGKTNERLP